MADTAMSLDGNHFDDDFVLGLGQSNLQSLELDDVLLASDEDQQDIDAADSGGSGSGPFCEIENEAQFVRMSMHAAALNKGGLLKSLSLNNLEALNPDRSPAPRSSNTLGTVPEDFVSNPSPSPIMAPAHLPHPPAHLTPPMPPHMAHWVHGSVPPMAPVYSSQIMPVYLGGLPPFAAYDPRGGAEVAHPPQGNVGFQGQLDPKATDLLKKLEGKSDDEVTRVLQQEVEKTQSKMLEEAKLSAEGTGGGASEGKGRLGGMSRVASVPTFTAGGMAGLCDTGSMGGDDSMTGVTGRQALPPLPFVSHHGPPMMSSHAAPFTSLPQPTFSGPPPPGSIAPATSGVNAPLVTSQPSSTSYNPQSSDDVLPIIPPALHPHYAPITSPAVQSHINGMRRCQSTADLSLEGAGLSGAGGASGSTTLLSETFDTQLRELMSNEARRLGRISVDNRNRAILRFRQKRHMRNFSKRVTYQCRKTLADTRPRIRGRFARTDDEHAVLPTSTSNKKTNKSNSKQKKQNKVAKTNADQLQQQQQQQQQQHHQQQQQQLYQQQYQYGESSGGIMWGQPGLSMPHMAQPHMYQHPHAHMAHMQHMYTHMNGVPMNAKHSPNSNESAVDRPHHPYPAGYGAPAPPNHLSGSSDADSGNSWDVITCTSHTAGIPGGKNANMAPAQQTQQLNQLDFIQGSISKGRRSERAGGEGRSGWVSGVGVGEMSSNDCDELGDGHGLIENGLID